MRGSQLTESFNTDLLEGLMPKQRVWLDGYEGLIAPAPSLVPNQSRISVAYSPSQSAAYRTRSIQYLPSPSIEHRSSYEPDIYVPSIKENSHHSTHSKLKELKRDYGLKFKVDIDSVNQTIQGLGAPVTPTRTTIQHQTSNSEGRPRQHPETTTSQKAQTDAAIQPSSTSALSLTSSNGSPQQTPLTLSIGLTAPVRASLQRQVSATLTVDRKECTHIDCLSPQLPLLRNCGRPSDKGVQVDRFRAQQQAEAW